MIRNKNLGISLADSVNILAAKYSVTERALYKDWKQRKRWLPLLLQMEDPHLFFLDLLSTHKELFRLCSMEFLKSDNSSARVGCLRLLRDLNLDFAELITLHQIEERLTVLEQQKVQS